MSEDNAQDLAESLRAYLAGKGYIDPEFSGVERLTGGSSHDTWAFDLSHGQGTCRTTTPLIVRCNLRNSSLDMPPDAEFRLLRWLRDQGIPVARPCLYATTDSPLPTPLLISERIKGFDLRKVMARSGSTLDRQAIGMSLVALQARIHALDVASCPLEQLVEDANEGVAREVQRWTQMFLAASGGHSHPLGQAAVAWLQAHIPRIEQACIVHGDFKANNILWTDDGLQIPLDWELSHVGDPIEDLGWTMLWLTPDDLVCGLLPPCDYVSAYETLAGRSVDRRRLFFWQLFALVKLSAILRTGSGTTFNAAELDITHGMLSRGAACLDAAIGEYLLATTRTGELQ